MANSRAQEARIALLGPQVTNWTPESLSGLQSALLQNPNLRFLTKTLERLSTLWSRLEKDCSVSEFCGQEKLKELEDFAAGRSIPDPQNLSNTHLAPLTVVSQVVDFVRAASGPGLDKKSGLLEFQAAQGFCVGFLSAAALASSSNWVEFERNVPNALRLAACLGVVVDAEDASHALPDRATAVSVRWKTAIDRAYLETSLDLFPDAYVSCITDDRTLTVTLPNRDQSSFCSRLGDVEIATTSIGLDGCYHHPRHAKAAQALKQICSGNDEVELPNADKLRLPLRSTADADLITSGALHEVAIELILCRRAHWYQTVKLTVAEFSHGEVEFVALGKDSHVPRSLLPGKPSLTQGISPHDDAPSLPSVTEEVAVVGMACRFPQADSVEEFWQLLSSGATSIGKLPVERFNPADISREPKLADFWGNFLRRPDVFDHRFFGISGLEAKSMDPQQRLALQVAYEALESSGYCSLPHAEKMTDVGCYLGVGSVDYEDNVASEKANAFSATGTLRAFISGRISHFFGWTGPSITFDTACSSSAVAIHTACKALLAGECSMALAGGVNVITSPNLYQNLSAASFLNPNGSSRAFDAAAGGYCRGEGAGILALKPLSRARVDGDTVLGVISGSAVNQGSNCSSITVPDSQSQSTLYKRALSIGRMESKEVTYVEAHGTGTPVGDPIEHESVRLALSGPWRTEELFLGSVKDSIGHTEAASGAAGVIKTILMMQHKTIPKQANFVSLNPRIKVSPSDRITVPKATQSWTAQRQVALVNNYGAAGSNVAIALRGHTDTPLSSKRAPSGVRDLLPSTVYPILLSAKSANSLQSYMNALKLYLPKVETSFGNVAYNIARRQNPSFEHRAAFTAVDAESFISLLNSTSARTDGTTVRREKSPVVLSFGGQTGCSVTVSRELYDGCDLFRNCLNECDAVCHALGLPSIFPGILRGDTTEDIVSLHCMLLSLQVSSAKCWINCGLEVDTLIGHSFGQLSALCVADSISLEDALRLVSGRARLMQDGWGPDRGVMLSVECDREEIEGVVNLVNSTRGFRVDVACYNGPRSFVLAGDTSSMRKVEDECRSFKTARLQNTHAYHSYVADGILHGLKKVAESVTLRPPRIRVETCSSNGPWSQFTAEEVVQHTRQPVYFVNAVERIATRLPSAVWLEAGSASPIIAMTRRIISKSDRSDTFVPMDLGSAEATINLANAACHLWRAGCATQHWPFHRYSCCRYENLNLPPYQFEETRHWIQYKPKSELPSTALTPNPTTKVPNLVSIVKSDGTTGEHLFSVDTSNIVFDLAGRGHAVAGRGLCPASMYIEIAAKCAIAICGSTSGSRLLPHIEGLTMSAPLGLGGESTVFMRLRRTAQDTWDFSILSQPPIHEDMEDGGTEHAKGQISLVPTGDTFAESRLKLLKRFARTSQIDRILNSSSATGISGAIVYGLFSGVVEYANYYHGVKSLSALDNEVIGFVTVPKDRPLGMDPVVCDPISLDNFLQVAGIHVNCLSYRKEDEVFMCTAVEEVIFSAPFMTNKVDSRTWTVYSRYETTSKVSIVNDIFVYDADSRDLVLAIMGANFRSVPFKSLVRSLARLENAGATVRNASDSDSEDLEDSGYQTRLPTPPSDEYEKQSTTHISFPDQPTIAPLPKGLQTQEPLEEPTKSSNLVQLVREMFGNIMEIPMDEIEPASKLDDLGIDSLLVTEVLVEVQKRFHVSITQAQFMQCTDVLSLCRRIQRDETIADGGRPVDEIRENNDPSDKIANGYSNSARETHDNDAGYEGQTKNNLAVVSHDCFVQAKGSYNQHAETTGFADFCIEAFPLQSELVLQYVVAAFASLGCALQGMESGDEVPTFQYDLRHEKLIPQLYKVLEDAGVVKKENDGTFRRTAVSISMVPAPTLYSAMLDKFPQHTSETKLLHTAAPRLADCLSGAADPLALIFRDSAARALLEDVYTNAPMFKTGTLLLAQYLSSVLERFGGNREVRILELGAGTGGTTKYLVEKLVGLGTKNKFSYTFTDLSSSLVAAARRKFAKWSFMYYTVLDVEKEPGPQFAGAYDIVISTNCIHATKDLVQSTTNIRKMLRPDGVLCLVELTRNLFWFDLVFGLLEGWWLFSDGREHALADEQRWERCLRAAGFEWVDWSSSASKESDILRVITASPFKVVPSVDTSTTNSDLGNTGNSDIRDMRQTIPFKKVDGLDLLADIYFPPEAVDPGRSLPVALMIHGGGHIMLSRDDIRPEQTHVLLRSGFLPISVDYRLCPEMTLPEGPMTDVADALAWIRNVLPKFPLTRTDVQVDGERVVGVGWSTGGQLTMSLAWTSLPRGIRPPEAILVFYCPTDYEDPFWTKPNIPAGSEATATTATDQPSSYELEGTWAGVYDRPITSYNVPPTKRALGGWLARSDPRSRLALYMNWHGRALHVLLNGLDKRSRREPPAPAPVDVAAVSPLAQIRSGKYATPTFIIHPRQDDLIPWQQARRTWEALRAREIGAEIRIVEDLPHLFDVYREYQDNEAAKRVVMQGYEFLCRHVGLTLRD